MKGNDVMTQMVPITYRGYWDVPRIFLFHHEGNLYLFDCAFSEELEDYPEVFEVFLMPGELLLDNLPNDWTILCEMAVRRLGTVPVTEVRFDPTRRQFVDASVLDTLLPHPARSPG